MEIILTSIIAFATTNIDDIFILALFFGNKKYRERDIIVGQYLGISVLIGISFMGSLIGFVIETRYIGLLGLVPIYLGLKSVINLLKDHGSVGNDYKTALEINKINDNDHSILSVASVTIANGGDNVSIYIPLFVTLVMGEKLTMVFIFLMMTGIWCLFAKYLTKHPVVKKVPERYGDLITPFVFIFLGIYILYESGAFILATRI